MQEIHPTMAAARDARSCAWLCGHWRYRCPGRRLHSRTGRVTGAIRSTARSRPVRRRFRRTFAGIRRLISIPQTPVAAISTSITARRRSRRRTRCWSRRRRRATGGFQVNAFNGATGQLIWTLNDRLRAPQPQLDAADGHHADARRYVRWSFPAAGGTVLVRKTPNWRSGAVTRVAFFGITNYNQNPTAFNDAIQICTPITSDAFGNLYFGYSPPAQALPGYANGIPSGLARISATAAGSFVSAQALGRRHQYPESGLQLHSRRQHRRQQGLRRGQPEQLPLRLSLPGREPDLDSQESRLVE